jgi:hypothetical protein
MKYLKYFESNETFVKGDIVRLKDPAKWGLTNEPFEIIGVTTGPEHEDLPAYPFPKRISSSKQYNTLKSLIREFSANWILNKDIIHLTEKEKADLKIKLRILKFNI